MDSVIAKLDNSVFGMLTEQEPRILISGVNDDDIDFVNRISPDFVIISDDTSDRSEIGKNIRIIYSAEDIPPFSGPDGARIVDISSDMDPEALIKMIKKERPDVISIDLSASDISTSDRLSSVHKLVRAARSVKQDLTHLL